MPAARRRAPAVAERPDRTPVAAERLEADRLAMEQKVARLQARAIKLQGKEALRLAASGEIKRGEVKPTGPSSGAKSGPGRSDARRATATAWQKRRPASADSKEMPASMRQALLRGSTKADGEAEREFTPTVARPSFRSSAPPQPAPDERALRLLVAAAQSDGTMRAGSPTSSLPVSARSKRASTAWSPDRASRDSALHFSPQRRRNPGLVTGSPPWPLHRVAVSQAVAESLSLRNEASNVLRSRSSSLAEYRQRHSVPPQYDISYLDENDGYLDRRDGSWYRRERKSRLPIAQDAEALRSLLRNGMASARSTCTNADAETQEVAKAADSSGDKRYVQCAQNVLDKVFKELSNVRPAQMRFIDSSYSMEKQIGHTIHCSSSIPGHRFSFGRSPVSVYFEQAFDAFSPAHGALLREALEEQRKLQQDTAD
eukprot:COSAG02_NODE_7711_length_2881_cov_1.801582_2_plen_429_part_00